MPQALSKRIHYGMFVAEAKFRKQAGEYTELIRRQDGGAILDLLTDRAVELKVGGWWGGDGVRAVQMWHVAGVRRWAVRAGFGCGARVHTCPAPPAGD